MEAYRIVKRSPAEATKGCDWQDDECSFFAIHEAFDGGYFVAAACPRHLAQLRAYIKARPTERPE